MTLKKFLTIGFVAAVLVACGDDSSSATDSDEVSSSSACEDCDGSSSSKEKSSSSSRKNGDAGTESGMTSSAVESRLLWRIRAVAWMLSLSKRLAVLRSLLPPMVQVVVLQNCHRVPLSTLAVARLVYLVVPQNRRQELCQVAVSPRAT